MMKMPRLTRLWIPVLLALTSACGGGKNGSSAEMPLVSDPDLYFSGYPLLPDTSLIGSNVSVSMTSWLPDIVVSDGPTINGYDGGAPAADPVPQNFEPGMLSWQNGDLTLGNAEQSFTFHEIDPVPAEDAPRIPLSANRIDGILMRESVGIEGLILMRLPDCDETRDCNQWHLNPRHEPSWYGLDELFSHGNDHLDSHYHGLSGTLFEDTVGELRQVGMAADGYPIASGWFDDNGMMRRATSSYQLKTGYREPGVGFSEPSGPYNGEYVEDYEYVPGSGDLDQCNAMVVNGIYTYFMTPEFPYLMNCLRSVPHDSFLINAP